VIEFAPMVIEVPLMSRLASGTMSADRTAEDDAA